MVQMIAGLISKFNHQYFSFSPECSVHQPSWQPSTQIENRGDLIDKAVECHSLDLDEALAIDENDNYHHIYYELEVCFVIKSFLNLIFALNLSHTFTVKRERCLRR